MSFLHGFSLARQKNACTYSMGLSHSSYNILRLIIVELLDAPVHQNIFMSQIVALPSNHQPLPVWCCHNCSSLLQMQKTQI